MSDEDLDYLAPGVELVEAARAMLDCGPSVVLVTAGGDGVHVVTADVHEALPVAPVEVVDTIGAGDSFGAGFVTWLAANRVGPDDLADPDLLIRAARAANAVAAVVVTRRGADPPFRSELPDGWAS